MSESDYDEYNPEEEEFDYDFIVNLIKSLVDNSFDKFARINKAGFMENKALLMRTGELDDFDEDFHSKINEVILKKMDGTLIIIEEKKQKTTFNYNYNNKDHKIVMAQYPDYRGFEIYFIFTLIE